LKGFPEILGRPAFLGFVLLFFFGTHLYRITDPPGGYHRWRETDTVAVAHNFATESWDFFRPRVNQRGATDGVVGMELPVYGWTVGAASTLGWDIHGWARLLTVLGACAALFGFHRVVRRFSGDAALAGLAAFIAACAPLLSFYGRKMMPDVWALAFATNALWLFLKWSQGGRGVLGILAAVLTAVAGSIKPTYLAVGLPMVVALWKVDGAAFLRNPRAWWFAAGALLPVWFWLQYARGLALETPFAIEPNWDAVLAGIRSDRFYKNVFRTWLFELTIGLPVVWAFVIGLARVPRLRNAAILVAWIVGVYVTYFLTGEHCASAHDYYTLSAVFPIAVVTSLGIAVALRSSRRWARVLALVALASMPVYGFARMSARWGEPYDFWGGRARAALHLPAGSLVVSHDPTPCFLLYCTDTKGWHLPPGGSPDALADAARQGARYLLVEKGLRDGTSAYRDQLGAEVYSDFWLTAWELVRPDDGGGAN
jgi:4-amino-4-deoxy-L-arabinose transferase-like glycosyltransferase